MQKQETKEQPTHSKQQSIADQIYISWIQSKSKIYAEKKWIFYPLATQSSLGFGWVVYPNLGMLRWRWEDVVVVVGWELRDATQGCKLQKSSNLQWAQV